MPALLAALAAVSAWLKTIKISAMALLYGGLVLCGVAGAEVYEHSFRFKILFLRVEALGPQLADLKASDAAARRAAEAHVVAVAAAGAAVSKAVAAVDAAAQVKLATVYQTLTKEVPIYVTAQNDADCRVDAGAVRLLDAGADGVPVVSVPTVQPDGAAAPASLSDVVANALVNDAAARANAQQLSDLQAWVADQQRVFATPADAAPTAVP